VGGVEMYVDLGAEKIIAAEKDGKKIAVEIKSFIGRPIFLNFILLLDSLSIIA
jgi:hypothetical protein